MPKCDKTYVRQRIDAVYPNIFFYLSFYAQLRESFAGKCLIEMQFFKLKTAIRNVRPFGRARICSPQTWQALTAKQPPA